jgi:hypothetical protein
MVNNILLILEILSGIVSIISIIVGVLVFNMNIFWVSQLILILFLIVFLIYLNICDRF